MNNKTIRIAGWALGLSMAVAGIGAAVGASYAINGNEPMMAKAATTTTKTLSIGWGTASESDETDAFQNYTAVSGSATVAGGSISFSTAKNSSGSNPAYNSGASELRLYYHSSGSGGSVTFTPSSGITITGAVMSTSTSPSVKYSVDGGAATAVSVSNNTYTVSGISASSSLTFQNVNTTNTQLRITKVILTYQYQAADSVETVTVSAGSLTGSYKGSAYIQCTAQADGNNTNDVTWTLSADTTFVADQTEVTGASIDSNGKVTFEDNLTVYAFATSTVTAGVRGYAACTATGLIDIPSFGLIESTDDLYDGMTVLIGATDYSKLMSTTQNTNNRGVVDAQQKGTSKAITTSSDEYQELTLSVEETSGGDVVYSFDTGSGYLYAASSSKNYLRTEADLDDEGRFAITIDDDGVATMEAQGENTNKYLRFNTTLFSCYSTASSQYGASIFAPTQTITAKQKVDTFVAKYMKMNSIATSDEGDKASGYVACKSNWSNVNDAYDKMGSDAWALFVAGDYADAVARFNSWATANSKTLNPSTGVLSTFNIQGFGTNQELTSATIVITITAITGVLATGAFIYLHKRKENRE